MLNRLRDIFNFANDEESKQKHREDHAVLHRAYNDIARMYPAQTSSASNSANLKAAIADAISGGFGSTVFIPPETYLLNDYHTIANVSGIRIVGAGHRSRLVSTLNDVNHAVLEFDDVRESVIRDLYFGFNADIGGAVRFRNVTGGSVTPSMNVVEGVRIEGAGKVQFPIIIGGMDYIDRNNDFMTFRNVYAIGYTQTGVYMRAHSQSYGNLFDQCYLYGNGVATHGINAGGNFAGNFIWRGGFIGGHTVSDFNLGRSYQSYMVEGGNGEDSACFMTSDNQAYQQISVRGFRWAGNGIGALNKAVRLSGNVQATFDTCKFGDGSGDKEVLLEFKDLHPLSRIKVLNTTVFSSAFAVFNETLPNELTGGQKVTNEGNGTTVALTL